MTKSKIDGRLFVAMKRNRASRSARYFRPADFDQVVLSCVSQTLSIRKGDYWNSTGDERDRVAPHNAREANSIINSHRDVRKIRYSSPPIRKTWPAAVQSAFPRIIAIRLAALNRTELILTCNINRVLRLRASVIVSFGANARGRD